MDPTNKINVFLDKIRKKHLSNNIVSGIYLLLAVLIGGFTIINLYASYAQGPNSLILPLISIIAIFIVTTVVFSLIRPILKEFSREQAALSAEKCWSELNNSLINSCQLQKTLKNPKSGVSHALIERSLQLTERKIQNLDINLIRQNPEPSRNLNRFLAALLVITLARIFIPDFFTLGYHRIMNSAQQEQFNLTQSSIHDNTFVTPSPAYSISKIQLKFNYPAYTKLDSETHIALNGEIHVLPGTEVQISAVSNHLLIGADLIFNGSDAFLMHVEDRTKISASFMVREKGFYQFRIKNEYGNKILLPTKYPIDLKKDLAPKIILFLSNPKPVYMDNEKIHFFYEGDDDFGIQSVDLIFNKNSKTELKRIKTIRGQETKIKGGYTWNLNEMFLSPGDKIEYYLEIKDNDNVDGPHSGQSEIYSFSIFDSRKELEHLIALQDELTGLLIDLLSETLINHEFIITGKLQDPIHIKKSVAVSSDRLIRIIQLAQKIHDQAKPAQMFSPPYLTFFKNIEIGMAEIREEQIELIKNLDAAEVKTTPVGLNSTPILPLGQKLIKHLERDILFLVKINNQQKMDQVINLEKQLQEMTDSLREEFHNIQNKKSPENTNELRQRLQKFKHLLNKMMEQLASQTQGLPDEFFNPDSVKKLDLGRFKVTLDKIMDMVNKGKIDQAMKELEKMSKDLQTMTNQLDHARNSMDEMIDMELMEKVNRSIEELNKLEKKQKVLLNQTAKINKTLREKQAENFEGKLESLFKSLKKDVESAQTILKDITEFLKDNEAIKKQEKLIEQETQLNAEFQKLRQETVDSTSNPKISDKFTEMRKVRSQLGELAMKKRELQMETYQEIKNTLPELTDKYDGLMEFAELFDIREFNSLFKSTYPLAFRWQHKLRMIPRPHKELSDRLNKDIMDLRVINAEISKKLGSMTRELDQEYNSLVSKKNKTQLREIAKQQNQLRQQSKKLAEQFSKMEQENPMVDPDLSSKMSSAQRYMKMAEKNLKKPDVPKSIESENGTIEKFSQMRDMLNQFKEDSQGMSNSRPRPIPKIGKGRARDHRQGGPTRMQKEKVDLPSEDQYKGAMKFRAEILEAMKERYPVQYERFVSEYYKELVK